MSMELSPWRWRLNDTPGDAGAEWPALADLDVELHAGGGVDGYPFQARDYLETWAATIGKARRARLCFLSAEDRERGVRLFAPFAIEKINGVRVLSFADGGVVDYNAPLVIGGEASFAPAEWIGALRRLAPSFDLARLRKMPARLAQGSVNPFTPPAGRHADRAYAMSLLNAQPQKTASIKDSRRQRKRLESLGVLNFVVASETDQALHITQTMMQQKSRRYVETRGKDGMERPGYRDYFAAMTERFAHARFVHVSALEVDGAPISTHWGLAAGRRFYYLMPSYEGGDRMRYSPGRLLLEELIVWAGANGLNHFDFGEGDEPYKRDYCDEQVDLNGDDVANGVVGAAVLAMLDGKRLVRRGRTR